MTEARNSNNFPTMATAFAIGDWHVNPAANTLDRGEEIIAVEPKVMDLLSLLAAQPGRVFSREELDLALWPNVTVGDDTLARAISKLRKALDDSATSPRFVETIPKRGYRLIAAVAEAVPPLEKPGPKRSRFIVPGALAVLFAAILVLAIAPPMLQRPAQSTLQASAMPSAAAPLTERADDLYMLFTRADNEAAIALYERAIATDMNYAPAQAGLANALVQRVIRWRSPPGSGPSALTLTEALNKGLTTDGEAAAVIARAIDLGERATRLAPDDADAIKALAFAYSAKGDLARASDLYERAADIDADAWEVMINRGELATVAGDEAAAIVWFERAYDAMTRLYAEEPQRVGQWRTPLGVSIAEKYENSDDAVSAEAWYRRVLEQTPFEPEATRRLAGLLRERGDIAEANNLCRELKTRIDALEDCEISIHKP